MITQLQAFTELLSPPLPSDEDVECLSCTSTVVALHHKACMDTQHTHSLAPLHESWAPEVLNCKHEEPPAIVCHSIIIGDYFYMPKSIWYIL